ncbi:hypothetical protein I7G59_06620 [Sinorhizobium meliloti]|uniref:hypothetical protein n=1 Tax=Rhizobium meliloti TaxID=382 RepID=UPI002380956D|nr:hypothetical protein [Sinorhizobium meliloti]MDE3797008.1 hypothetical protein [Sinorhizobium meliloti]
MVLSIHKGWSFLTAAIVLVGIGGSLHFGAGIGLMMAAGGCAFAALVAAIDYIS